MAIAQSGVTSSRNLSQEASQAVEFATSRSSSSPAGEDADRSDLRDLAVIKKLNDIRLQVRV